LKISPQSIKSREDHIDISDFEIDIGYGKEVTYQHAEYPSVAATWVDSAVMTY
jgi:hypothetical protein